MFKQYKLTHYAGLKLTYLKANSPLLYGLYLMASPPQNGQELMFTYINAIILFCLLQMINIKFYSEVTETEKKLINELKNSIK